MDVSGTGRSDRLRRANEPSSHHTSEQTRGAGKKESAKWKELATGAVELQRKLSVLQARRDCLAARQESLAHPKNQRGQPQKKLAERRKRWLKRKLMPN